MKTFWLSFCDATKPEGQQFLGACLVDITQDDADEAAAFLAMRFPHALPGAEWIAAASRKAHRAHCNPGGEMASVDVSNASPELLALYPRNTLMTRTELETIAPLEPMVIE